jgi:hypothetical protein
MVAVKSRNVRWAEYVVGIAKMRNVNKMFVTELERAWTRGGGGEMILKYRPVLMNWDARILIGFIWLILGS